MPAYTIVTTSATQGSEAAEVNTLSDEFVDVSEALGYSRRMAEEMVGMADQLLLDFDYSNIGLYDGDLIDEDLDPEHPAFLGLWVLDVDGAAFVSAEEFLAGEAEVDPA
ncbi:MULTISPECIES: hypothetical protein [unclassified Brevundimonas]|jgi:hypothetical protein|uniref:hypothetical protein n=1 Tax=unclassified Brevundimonas TaxID=2622653 RepID=UPI000D470629|nr:MULTISPECIES: hypothetical protein [unclassified Brevundimonas]PRA29534.1 hypothetical protein CQ024_08680 [Brevundimonas sp. MYb27]PQZ83651.1 hypothetical protein CQ026_04400 [Brevundimonas sp. MYb31]PRB15760.1 hypothetical protein CQ039_07080 [Brevundimonas sp. MYb52]PRB36257.1 hypothetical protein CQ035_05780 [Brevundimonas sp. MYb46]PRB46833.1 hypothetical protein CQ028_10920 [Brevundimonas sp. MYb33]